MKENAQAHYPNLAQVFGIFGMYLAFTLGATILIAISFMALKYQNRSVLNFTAYCLAGILLLWWARHRKHRYEKARPVFHFYRVPWLLYPLLALTTLSMIILLDPLSNLIPVPGQVMKFFAELSKTDLPTFLMVTIAGPFLEELLFRGIILDGLLKNYNPLKAIVWSSLFFGLFHFNPWQLIPAFFLGLLIGYLYWKTNSLLPGLFIHWMNNTSIWVAGLFIGQEISNIGYLIGSRGVYFVVLGCSVISLMFSLYLLRSLLLPGKAETSTRV